MLSHSTMDENKTRVQKQPKNRRKKKHCLSRKKFCNKYEKKKKLSTTMSGEDETLTTLQFSGRSRKKKYGGRIERTRKNVEKRHKYHLTVRERYVHWLSVTAGVRND